MHEVVVKPETTQLCLLPGGFCFGCEREEFGCEREGLLPGLLWCLDSGCLYSGLRTSGALYSGRCGW